MLQRWFYIMKAINRKIFYYWKIHFTPSDITLKMTPCERKVVWNIEMQKRNVISNGSVWNTNHKNRVQIFALWNFFMYLLILFSRMVELWIKKLNLKCLSKFENISLESIHYFILLNVYKIIAGIFRYLKLDRWYLRRI